MAWPSGEPPLTIIVGAAVGAGVGLLVIAILGAFVPIDPWLTVVLVLVLGGAGALVGRRYRDRT